VFVWCQTPCNPFGACLHYHSEQQSAKLQSAMQGFWNLVIIFTFCFILNE
jgi:hypothetical protein